MGQIRKSRILCLSLLLILSFLVKAEIATGYCLFDADGYVRATVNTYEGNNKLLGAELYIQNSSDKPLTSVHIEVTCKVRKENGIWQNLILYSANYIPENPLLTYSSQSFFIDIAETVCYDLMNLRIIVADPRCE